MVPTRRTLSSVIHENLAWALARNAASIAITIDRTRQTAVDFIGGEIQWGTAAVKCIVSIRSFTASSFTATVSAIY